jgi:MFS family permease
MRVTLSGRGERPPARRTAAGLIEAAVASPVLAYGGIVALQLRVIWRVWDYKDLTPYDTAGYFSFAAGWAHGLHDTVVWSPLYTSLWGTLIAAVKDVTAAVMVQRVAIVLLATVLVLALMRALIGPAIGLLLAAWWAVLAVNFNVLTEAHLFGVVPVLVAAMLVVRSPGRGALGAALGILLGAALLARNELMIAALIFAAAIAVHELRERRAGRHAPASVYARAYGVPLAIVCLLTAGAYWRSDVQGSRFLRELADKHEVNVCQAYAFNYQQRHPTRFTGNPFTDCRPLMQQTFGRPRPSLLEATLANPRAMAAFAAWNIRLFPSGLQVSLLDATSTGDNPDYVPPKAHRGYALVLGLTILALLIAGFVAVRRDREFWRREWIPRVWAWILLGSVAVTAVIVALTQRPRAEYLYGLTVGLLALVGASVAAVARRVGGARLLAPTAAAVTLVLVILLGPYYSPRPRPIHDGVERLQIVRHTLQRRGSVLVSVADNTELCSYLARAIRDHCSSPSWAVLRAQARPGTGIHGVLDRVRADAVYADAAMIGDPAMAPLLAEPRRYGWRQVAGGTGPGGPWRVLVRAGAAAQAPSSSSRKRLRSSPPV